MASDESSTKSKWYFCEHCDEFISKTLYYKHRKLFYDRKAKKWKKTNNPQFINVDKDFIFSDSDDATDEGKHLLNSRLYTGLATSSHVTSCISNMAAWAATPIRPSSQVVVG